MTKPKTRRRVIHSGSTAERAEQSAIKDLLAQLHALLGDSAYEPSKWQRLTEDCLAEHGIAPGSHEQAVIFTEYADSAEWMVGRLRRGGYTVAMYSGRQNSRRA